MIGTWKSDGYQAKWGTSALFAFAFIEGSQIRIVAVGLKGYPMTITNVESPQVFGI